MQLATGQRAALATLNLPDQLDITFNVSGQASTYAPV